MTWKHIKVRLTEITIVNINGSLYSYISFLLMSALPNKAHSPLAIKVVISPSSLLSMKFTQGKIVISKSWTKMRNNFFRLTTFFQAKISSIILVQLFFSFRSTFYLVPYKNEMFTLNPLYVQLPNFISQSWSSKGNQVMSIGQEDLKMPGGIQVHRPALVTTTLVAQVESKDSLALIQKVLNH